MCQHRNYCSLTCKDVRSTNSKNICRMEHSSVDDLPLLSFIKKSIERTGGAGYERVK